MPKVYFKAQNSAKLLKQMKATYSHQVTTLKSITYFYFAASAVVGLHVVIYIDVNSMFFCNELPPIDELA